MTRRMELEAAARAMLLDQPAADIPCGESTVSLGDVVAWMVANAVEAREERRPPARPRPAAKAVASLRGNAVAALALIVDDRVSWKGSHGNAGTQIGWGWHYGGHFVTHGRTGHVSDRIPGIHAELPDIPFDEGAVLASMRRALRKADVGQAAISGISVATGASADDAVLTVPCPGHPRLAISHELRWAAHMSNARLDRSLADFAQQIARRDANLDQIPGLIDLAERELAKALLDPTLPTGQDLRAKPAVVTGIGTGMIGKGLTVALSAEVDTFDDLHRPCTRRISFAVVRHDDGRAMPSISSLVRDEVDHHKRRVMDMRRRPGGVVEFSPMAIRIGARFGMTPADMLTALDDTFHHSWGQEDASLRVRAGRITGTIRLSPDVIWSDDCIKVRALKLSREMSMALVGRPMTDAVDHPLLAGLTIRRVEDGKPAGPKSRPFTIIHAVREWVAG